MFHIKSTPKSVQTVINDLTAAAEKHQFGVLYEHNLRQTMRHKGVDFPNRVRVLEVCNPHHAAAILTERVGIVWQDTPGDRAGIRPGDLLLSINGNSIRRPIVGIGTTDEVAVYRSAAAKLARLESDAILVAQGAEPGVIGADQVALHAVS